LNADNGVWNLYLLTTKLATHNEHHNIRTQRLNTTNTEHDAEPVPSLQSVSLAVHVEGVGLYVRTVATNGPPDDMWRMQPGGMIRTGKIKKLGENPVPLPLCTR
jgi:hypothetical protein